MPPKDMFGNTIGVFDIIAVVSANNQLEVAMVVDIDDVDNPVIQRFNCIYDYRIRSYVYDGSLRSRIHVFNHSVTSSILLTEDSTPEILWLKRFEVMCQ